MSGPLRALLIFFWLKNTTRDKCALMRRGTIQKVLSPKVFCLLVVVEVDCYSLNGLATVVRAEHLTRAVRVNQPMGGEDRAG